jgi:hypothetical protein
VAIGQEDDHRVGLQPFGLVQGEAQPALRFLELLDADRRQFRPAQPAGEAGEDQRSRSPHRSFGMGVRDLPQDDGGRRNLLARSLALQSMAADACQRLGHGDIVGGYRAAGGAVQIADRGAALGFRR